MHEPSAGDGTRGRSVDPLSEYRRTGERHRVTLHAVREEMRRVESARLATFVVGAVVALLHDDLPIGSVASLGLAGVLGIAFVFLVVRHRRLRGTERRTAVAVALAEAGEARLLRDWSRIAEAYGGVGYSEAFLDPSRLPPPDHPYARDLDLFGEASVRALFGPTPTRHGSETLARWLLRPAPPEEVARRQRAAAVLADDREAREALVTEALLVGQVSDADWRRFLDWLDDEPVFGPGHVPTWAIVVARALPPVTILLAVLDLAPAVDVSGWTWGAPLAVQAALGWAWSRRLGAYLGAVGKSTRGLRRYHALFEAWSAHRSADATVGALQERLRGEAERPAHVEIRRLQRWLDAADSRASSLHVVFAVGLLWEVHVAWGLERWRRDVGRHVRGWFEALGELEALSALATLAHDHPDWCMPELVEGVAELRAEGLGHPMIPESLLRTSDVALDPPGRFLLVTGSNMSGKSTLLRSLGLAAVMAQAGAVVCARTLRTTPTRTFTSMRIEDSLAAGVSLFMAELYRLKRLVDAARDESGPPLLYLVDEVLQGTNSEERRIAARRIVRHLLSARAIGAVTTHDLTLHEDDRLDEAATKVHFREKVGGAAGGAVLSFDYCLRPGLATSRNALKLLEIVGLGEGKDGAR